MKTQHTHARSPEPVAATDCCGAAPARTVPPAHQLPAPGAPSQVFRIATMDCSAEESDIRRVLEPIAGITSLSFQLGARTLAIHASEDALPLALAAIRKAGYDPQLVTANDAAFAAEGNDDAHDHDHAHGFNPGIWRFVLALVMATGAELLAYFAPDTMPWKVAGMALAAVAIWLAGLDTYKKGLAALLRGKLNINALMSVAVTGAFVIGQWPEAAMVMALYAIAEWIEAKAVDRARNAIKGLLDLAPAQALVRQASGDWVLTPVGEVPLGASVRVKPGERVPLDGVVTLGHSAINQAPITGESLPQDK